MNGDELPEGWKAKKVGDLFEAWGGATPSTSEPSYWGGSIPWISSKDVKKPRLSMGSEFITKKALSETRLRVCPPGSVLVVVRSGVLAHTLPVALLESEAVINQDVKAFDSGDRSVNEWFALFLREQATDILNTSRKDGTTVQSVGLEKLKELMLPLPPRSERDRIMAKVEELLASVNAARDRLARVPAILKRFRQAVLAAACDGRLTGADTSDWTNTSLGEVFSVQTGATPLRKRTDYYLDGTIPWIKTGQVQNGEIHHAEEFITDLAVEETNAKVFPPGTILVAMYGEGRTRGQLARLRIAAATNQACAALVPRNRADDPSDFAFWFLRSQYDAMRDVAVGGNQPNLSLGLIKSWPVALPAPPEQREIVRRIEALSRVADAIARHVVVAAFRAEKTTQAILRRAFSGELLATTAAPVRARTHPPGGDGNRRVHRPRNSQDYPSAI